MHVPEDFRIDACWDGSALILRNRTALVVQVRTNGSIAHYERISNFPPSLSSYMVSRMRDSSIVPPGYGAKVVHGDGSARVSVEFADYRTLRLYGIAAAVEPFLPGANPASVYGMFEKLVNDLDKAESEADACLLGANLFKQVACFGAFSVRAGKAFATFGIDAGLTIAKTSPAISALWGLVQLGDFVNESAKDAAARLPSTISIAAKPGPPPDTRLPVRTEPTPTQPTRRILTVDNRVTNGMGMREDTTPARLTTQPWVYCTRRGCNIYGTERGTGGTYDAAVCQTHGERTTNGHDTDPSDDANPERFESTRYYGVRLADGTFGYVSEVWIRAADRGGLGLPGC